MTVGVIGGTGIDEIADFVSGKPVVVRTRFGEAQLVEGRLGRCDMLFLPRHGPGHALPPRHINYRAHIAALKKSGAQRVFAVCAVGSLSRDIEPGSLAILADFIDLARHRPDTFFDDPHGPVVHTDFTQPYCPEISAALASACSQHDVSHEPTAVYVGVDGPRYETPAEIRLFSSWGGHVIGMTGLPEATLAREAGLCYGAVAVVANLAAGISPTPLTPAEIRGAVVAAGDRVRAVLETAADTIPETRRCACPTNTSLVL